MATVEERLSRLEQLEEQRRDLQIDAGLRAQAFGLSQVHAAVGELKAGQDELRTDVATLKTDLAEVKQGIAQILERLDR